MSVYPEFADITDQLETKIMGISLYDSQIERLFDSKREMADAVRSYGRAIGPARRRGRRTPSGTGRPAASDPMPVEAPATHAGGDRSAA